MAKKIETQIRKTSTSNTSSQSILLEQYRALNSDYIQQRGEGVTRMNFFITAMSVVLGGALVFASRNDEMMISHIRLVLLAALILLITIGLDVYSFLIQRNIDIDRDIRGMARVKIYFVNLDPGLENFFVNGIDDTPTDFLTAKGFGMRRSAEIIIGFLFGFAFAVLSSYFPLTLEVNILIGVSMSILTALFLENNARRKLGKALRNAERELNFNKNVTAK
jgi:hypothetical protein